MNIKYFDNAATTKVAEEVLNEMLPYLKEKFGNPSSMYTLGRSSKRAIEEARKKVAELINCEPNEIYFTSSGSESDNTAIKGIAYQNYNKGMHIITSKIEHPAVLNTCHTLEKQGFIVTYLNVDKELIRKVNVVDVIPPELTVESEDNIYLFEGEEFVKPVYHANDNYDKDITDKVKVDSNVDTNKVGDYVLKYIVKDSSDNETTKEINVHVQEKRKNAKVVVSILNQTLNYYEKGQVVLSSPVVTGLNNATPKGTYKILSKSRNVTLVGENYESHVRYWMPFIGRSYGLHDASWRSNFGGQIYKTNGSHGCVNLPTNKAAQLYDLIEVGTPVIITD